MSDDDPNRKPILGIDFTLISHGWADEPPTEHTVERIPLDDTPADMNPDGRKNP